MNVVTRLGAQADIIRQFRWNLVEQNAPDAAFRFVDAVEESIERLSLMPEMGALREIANHALKGLRLWPVKDFLHGARGHVEDHPRFVRQTRS